MQDGFTVVIEQDADGVFIATVPALPGRHTAGNTEEEALELLKDAMRLHIEARLASGDEPIPQDVDSARVCIVV